MFIYEQVLKSKSNKCSLVSIIESQGSTSQKTGAKILVKTDGKFSGTIGGGLVESKGLALGKEVLKSKLTQKVSYNVGAKKVDDTTIQLPQVCGGSIKIFANGLIQESMDEISKSFDLWKKRQYTILVTIISHNRLKKGLLYCYQSSSELLNSGLCNNDPLFFQLVNEKKPLLHIDLEGNLFFIEPIFPKPQLLVVGGGHCGQALSQLGLWLGFDTTVIDNRDNINQQFVYDSEVNFITGDYTEELTKFPIDAYTYITLVTQGHATDCKALSACIESDTEYIGVIGSRRKINSLEQRFLKTGHLNKKIWNKIHAPIGLDINPHTVKEIALSIMSEIVSIRNGQCNSLKFSKKA